MIYLETFRNPFKNHISKLGLNKGILFPILLITLIFWGKRRVAHISRVIIGNRPDVSSSWGALLQQNAARQIVVANADLRGHEQMRLEIKFEQIDKIEF